MTSHIDICEEAARLGGRVLLDWSDRFDVREKGPSDLVTQADLEAQNEIRCFLAANFPDHAFLGEEDAPSTEAAEATLRRSEYLWIVDPLDGTTNYAHRVPHYCVSIALAHRMSVIAATIFNPLTSECFTAEADRGAFLNGSPIRTSRVDALNSALVAVSFPPRIGKGAVEFDELVKLIDAAQAVRRMGSAALNMCYLAAGRYDAYWATKTKIWDVAAGLLIVREAGGSVTSLDGLPFELTAPTPAAAATPKLNRELVALMGR